MGLWDKIKGELVDIIEWTDSSSDTMVHRFERYKNQIKYGAKLTVREGQVAVFINQGKLADIFTPGMYSLDTKNLPILSTLLGWAHGFNSPFVSEVYFVNTKRFTDQKWGTKQPITLRDKDFGIVRLRAFGTYVFKVKKADIFIREIVGTDGTFTTEEIVNQIRNLIVARFSDVLGESKTPFLDMAANLDELGAFVKKQIALALEESYGLELTEFLVENINVPEAVQEAIDKRASMGAVGNLQAYSQYQAANAMEDAAKNPSGMAGAGMGMGAGFAMGNQMAQAMSGPQASAPPPLPGGASFFAGINGQQSGPFTAQQLQQYVSGGQITPQTLVWKQGMAQWVPAGQVAELSSLFGPASPPPLPPQGGPPPLPPQGA